MTGTTYPDFRLHTLGWKAFQDLCVAVSEECLKRPVEKFLPTNDGGRDGAFVGKWADAAVPGHSTIQCKFTAVPDQTLTPSMMAEDIAKASELAVKGLAEDYIILTNHPVTAVSAQKIVNALLAAGVGNCQVFGREWITGQIMQSPRLRMLVPRLYGLGDLSQILDERAYAQAQMILSSLGDDLQKLVITDAHRRSVEAISKHNFVLLLGAPAAGKSTIGAGLAVGAADIWKLPTIKAISPEKLVDHINPHEKQFFWVDDAWGTTQYQKDRTEAWNQALPHVQAAIKRGTRFLLTSRDYIWRAARGDLKTQALPLLNHSQVVINVQSLTEAEKVQILYNHLRMGDQPSKFRTAIKTFLPAIAARSDFMPETARRLGSSFLAGDLVPVRSVIEAFFESPEDFLVDTISNLASDCKAAIALIYLAGGRIGSPVASDGVMADVCNAFGVSAAQVREALSALNGSLLLLALDEQGQYWTYKHPTIGDAFSTYVSKNPEFLTYFLRGAKPSTLMQEVVCGTVELQGAPVRVMAAHYPLLLQRMSSEDKHHLRTFASYRADKEFAAILIAARPDLLDGLSNFYSPISQDSDTSLLCRLHELDLLPEETRKNFARAVHNAAVADADASFRDEDIAAVLTKEETAQIVIDVREQVLADVGSHVSRVMSQWDSEYPPEDHFDELRSAFRSLAAVALDVEAAAKVLEQAEQRIWSAVNDMLGNYEPPPSSSSPVSASAPIQSALADVFRDVDA